MSCGGPRCNVVMLQSLSCFSVWAQNGVVSCAYVMSRFSKVYSNGVIKIFVGDRHCDAGSCQ